MTIDLKVKRTVVGVVMQGRSDANQYVTSVEILSSTDGVTYSTSHGQYAVNGIATRNFKSEVLLNAAVKTRFLKIQAKAFTGFPCMRVGYIMTPQCGCIDGYTGPIAGPCTACPTNTYKSESDLACQACPFDTVSLEASTYLAACTPRPLFGGSASCGAPDASMMTRTLCHVLAEQVSVTVHTNATLGTTQLVRYSFAESWGCNLQADLPDAQRISGAAPNQVLECPPVPGGAYIKADAPCQFACD